MGTISKLSEAHPYIYFYVDNPPGRQPAQLFQEIPVRISFSLDKFIFHCPDGLSPSGGVTQR